MKNKISKEQVAVASTHPFNNSTATAGQKIRLKYKMQDGDEILPAGMILSVTASNPQGVRASGEDRISRIFRHDCYIVV